MVAAILPQLAVIKCEVSIDKVSLMPNEKFTGTRDEAVVCRVKRRVGRPNYVDTHRIQSPNGKPQRNFI